MARTQLTPTAYVHGGGQIVEGLVCDQLANAGGAGLRKQRREPWPLAADAILNTIPGPGYLWC